MGKYTIAVIPGDGVGKEVVDEGIRVMETLGMQDPNLAFAFVRFDWGSEYYFRNGRMMPEDALETLATFDAIYLGAVGDPRLPDHVTLAGVAAADSPHLRSVRQRAAGHPLRRDRVPPQGQEAG